MVEATSAFFADTSSCVVASGTSTRCGIALITTPFARHPARKFYPNPVEQEMGGYTHDNKAVSCPRKRASSKQGRCDFPQPSKQLRSGITGFRLSLRSAGMTAFARRGIGVGFDPDILSTIGSLQ